MNTVSKIFIFSAAFSFLIVSIFLSNMAFEKQAEVVKQQEILQKDWITVSLNKDNESLQIIKMQGHRVELLEGKLEIANKMMQSKTDEVIKREELLVSTAAHLQETIDNLAKALENLDSSKRVHKYLNNRISSLSYALTKARKEISELKYKLKSKTPISTVLGVSNGN